MYLGDRIADDKPLSLSPALQTALVVSLVRHHFHRRLSAAVD